MNPLYRRQFLLSVIFCKLYLRFYPPLSLFSRRRLNNEPLFAPLRTNKGSISLFKVIKHTGEVKDTFKFVYNEKGRAWLKIIELVKRLSGRRYPAFTGNSESLSVVNNVRLTVQLLFSQVQKPENLQGSPACPLSGRELDFFSYPSIHLTHPQSGTAPFVDSKIWRYHPKSRICHL